jgi:hypothetical protein
VVWHTITVEYIAIKSAQRKGEVVASQKELISMLTSILGARLRWHLADGWVFDPVIVGPDIIEYTLKEGPHAGRHAIQHT